MAAFTVGDYLAVRLAELNIKHHFVVPGDYNLSLLDRLQAHPSLSQVGCTNELNCSLAAEGYARAHGIAVCVVTYSVGALSAFNGIGSAYAEGLPVILVSGAPNANDAAESRILHHTLGEPNPVYQMQMAKQITCYAASLANPHDAPHLIDEAISAALQTRKPVYLEVPANIAAAPCGEPGPVSAIRRETASDPVSLAKATAAAAGFIASKHKPVIMVGPLFARSDAHEELRRFAEALGCVVVVQPAAKGAFSEHHHQFAGVFWGQVGDRATNAIVNWADAVICVGTLFTDYSTVGWTALPGAPLLEIDINQVTLPHIDFTSVMLKDVLARMSATVAHRPATLTEYERIRPDPTIMHITGVQEALQRRDVVRQVQQLLTADTTLFVDTGECWFTGMQLRLPPGAKFEIEMQWGHIGWSIPAAFGYSLRQPQRRSVVLVGDGGFQMTAQEVSSMIRHRLPIIIFVFNNKGYTIEVEIHDGPYNRIKNWDYASLVETFNSTDGDAKGYRATTLEQLIHAIEKAKRRERGPTLIECLIDRDDCSEELITWGRQVALANNRPPPRHEP